MNTSPADSIGRVAEHYGLIVHQEGQHERMMAKYLNLMLNYQYALPVWTAPTINRGLLDRNKGLRCSFVIQDRAIQTRTAVMALNQRGRIPLFLLVPADMVAAHEKLCRGMSNVYLFPWEQVIGEGQQHLAKVVDTGLAHGGVYDMFELLERQPYEAVQLRLKNWLKNLETLPSMPAIVMRIMGMVNDPKTTLDDLGKLLISDPAIVHKIVQVVNSPAFAGSLRSREWTLKEAIPRLGMRKVGAIAQQIKLINTFVRPKDSGFVLIRFWEHSVACALLADRIYRNRLIRLTDKIEFNQYWIAALMHDIGKLVIGFFFYEWFDRVQEGRFKGDSFAQTEARLSQQVTHQRVSQLVTMMADMGPELTTALADHHGNRTGGTPSDLTCLLHVANNLSKGLGLGYFEDEEPCYDEAVLDKIGMSEQELNALGAHLGDEVIGEIKELVGMCM